MEFGKLRELIDIEECSEATRTSGDVTETWSQVDQVYAEFMDSRGREFVNARQLNAELTHVLRLRYDSTLTPQHRITWDSRVFNILSVRDVNERTHEMRVDCKEAV